MPAFFYLDGFEWWAQPTLIKNIVGLRCANPTYGAFKLQKDQEDYRKMRPFILIIMFLFLISSSYAENVSKTGTFSNLEYHQESGDLLGFEIRIVYTENGYEGTFQASEGGPESLVLIKNIIFEEDTIKFEIPADSDYAGKFLGKITASSLIGTLTFKNGNKTRLVLNRGKSYWD